MISHSTEDPALPPRIEFSIGTGRKAGGSRFEGGRSGQLARGTLNRYLLILKCLIFESSVRAGDPTFVAAPEGPEIRP